MNFKKASAFLAVFLLLAGYVYQVEFREHKAKQAEKEAAQKVLASSKDSINAIQLKNSYGEFEIKRILDQWKITKPLYTDCDENMVNTMLSGMASAKKENSISVLPAELSNFGLGENAITVGLTDANDQSYSYKLGDKTPVGSNVFVSMTDTAVFTVGESVKNNFSKDLFALRNKKMLQFKQNDVQLIKLKNKSGNHTFQKRTDNEWIIAGLNRPANRSKISSLLSKLENTNVKSFVDEEAADKRKYGIHRPQFEVELQLGPQQGSKKILFSKKMNDTYYGFDESRKPIFEVDEAVIKDLDQKLTDFRDTDFAKFQRNEIQKIEISYADTSFGLVKDSSDIWLTADHSDKIQSGKISAFFSSLDYTTIGEFVADGKFNAGKYGFSQPALSVKLSNDQGAELLNVTLGKIKGENIYARTSAYESVYLIPKSKLKDLKLNLDNIKEESPTVAAGE